MAITKIKSHNPITGVLEEREISLQMKGNKPALVYYGYWADATYTYVEKWECYPALPFALETDNVWRIRKTLTQTHTATGKLYLETISFPKGNTGYEFAVSLREDHDYFVSPDFD